MIALWSKYCFLFEYGKLTIKWHWFKFIVKKKIIIVYVFVEYVSCFSDAHLNSCLIAMWV